MRIINSKCSYGFHSDLGQEYNQYVLRERSMLKSRTDELFGRGVGEDPVSAAGCACRQGKDIHTCTILSL